MVAVAPALLAEGHQYTIYETKTSGAPNLALTLSLGLLSHGSGWGRLAGPRGPASGGARIICLPGGLGLLPSLFAPLDASLVPGFIALVKPALLRAAVPATIILVFLVAARGRESLVLATSTAFLGNVPFVTLAQFFVGANCLIQDTLNLHQWLVILINGWQNFDSAKISTVQQLLKHILEAQIVDNG